MIYPAEAIQEWINLVNMDHQDKIARFVLNRLYYLGWEAGENDELDVLHGILQDVTGTNYTIGKLLTIRSIIDYMMDEKGSIEAWNAKIDMVISDMNEDGGVGTEVGHMQIKLKRLLQEKAAWLETASSWKKLTRMVLSGKNLHQWERTNILRESLDQI